MKLDRAPDFYVLGESGHKVPAYLQGHLSESSDLLAAFPTDNPAGVFVIDPSTHRLVTFSGTVLDVPIEPAQPLTDPWRLLTADEPLDGRPDPCD